LTSESTSLEIFLQIDNSAGLAFGGTVLTKVSARRAFARRAFCL
jgi:hypothetical protein